MGVASRGQPHPSAARTSVGNGAAIRSDIGNIGKGRVGVVLNVTAVSGTSPTLDVRLQWSANGTDFFDAVPTSDAFPQRTSTGGAAAVFDIKAAYFRVAWTIGGTTPSFTFSVDALTF